MQNRILLHATEVLDSRRRPTLRVEAKYGDIHVEAKVPSGKSAGSREAVELRDQDGEHVSSAISNVNSVIAPMIEGMSLDPMLIDETMLAIDGTSNKSKLGANATLGVSMVLRRLAARNKGVPLWKYISEEYERNDNVGFPRLYMNVLNGGAHANFALPFQEYLIVVEGKPSESFKKGKNIFMQLGEIVRRDHGDVAIGDEGGYSPKCEDLHVPFSYIREAVGDDPQVRIAIDAAASEFCVDGSYQLGATKITEQELLNQYQLLVDEFNLISIEDPFDEFASSAFLEITKKIRGSTIIVADDYTVTNPEIVRKVVHDRSANGMIVKPNQVGTIKETYEAMRVAREADWKLIVSHRSGETDDTFIADLSVGVGAFGLKAGAPLPHERVVKYERLLAIEQEMYEGGVCI